MWGERTYTVESRIQADDPDAPFYFPSLLEKASAIGHLTYCEDAGNTLDLYAAKTRADALLSEFIRSFQAVEYRCIPDPMIGVHVTAGISDAATGIACSILVTKAVLDGGATVVSGVDYLSAPLE